MKASGKKYFVVGVTGGIGSGKSSVCEEFRRLGRYVVSADDIARELTETDETVRRAIRKVFGDEIYRPDGSLDRQALAVRVFSDSSLLDHLNHIVHPPTIRLIFHEIESLSDSRRSPYVLVEAALIFEVGLHTKMDYTIVVHAKEELRIARIAERDDAPEAEIAARIRAQMPAEQKRRRADFVIENNSSLGSLPAKVRFLDTLLGSMQVAPPKA